jgi:hypothetical protein
MGNINEEISEEQYYSIAKSEWLHSDSIVIWNTGLGINKVSDFR